MVEITRAAFLKKKSWSGQVELATDAGTVELTHLDKVYWAAEAYTKGDLLRYYLEVADYILPFLAERPAILKRYPNGVQFKTTTQTDQSETKLHRGSDQRTPDGGFFQQNLNPETVPPFLKTTLLTGEKGQKVNYAVYTGLASLLYLTNLGTIAHNPWHSRSESLDHPDYLIFDLDPHEAPFENVRQLALAVRAVLQAEGLESYIKTSGSSGLHLFVPLKAKSCDYQAALSFSEKLAEKVVAKHTDIATLERRMSDRKPHQVYLDWQQNARGKSVAAVYTVRAKPGATVSTPLEWSEVEKGDFSLADFTIKTVPKRLKAKGNLWQAFFQTDQKLTNLALQ